MMDITTILTAEESKKIGGGLLTKINDAITEALSKEHGVVEAEYAQKFDLLVENIAKKMDEKVETVMVESIRQTVDTTANNKMYGLVKDIVGLLENAGISTTEATRELQTKLQDANEKLAGAYTEWSKVKSELEDSEKNVYILNRLKGMSPKIIDAALEHFSDKTLLDVQDEIDAFAEGDFSQIMMDNTSDDEMIGDVSLDQVRDALQSISDDESKKARRVAVHESLSGNLKPLRVVGGSPRNPDITQVALDESVSGEQQYDADTSDAMDQISSFSKLGYRF